MHTLLFHLGNSFLKEFRNVCIHIFEDVRIVYDELFFCSFTIIKIILIFCVAKQFSPRNIIEIRQILNDCGNCMKPIVKDDMKLSRNSTSGGIQDQGDGTSMNW